MRSLVTALILIALTGCRFEQPIPAPLVTDPKTLIGDWKATDGEGRVIVSDLRLGRLRMLLKQGKTGMVLDAHVIEVDGHKLLQAQILAVLDAQGKQVALPKTRWLIWKIDRKDKKMSVQSLKVFPMTGNDNDAMYSEARAALAEKEPFEAVRTWQWVGSEQPAKL